MLKFKKVTVQNQTYIFVGISIGVMEPGEANGYRSIRRKTFCSLRLGRLHLVGIYTLGTTAQLPQHPYLRRKRVES